MKTTTRLTLAAVLLAATAVHAKDMDIQCAEMPSRDRACVIVSDAKLNKQGHIVAPFIVAAPNDKILIRGHFMEVECSGATPQAVGLQDANGSVYTSGRPWDMPKHTQRLANSMCEALPALVKANADKAAKAAKGKK